MLALCDRCFGGNWDGPAEEGGGPLVMIDLERNREDGDRRVLVYRFR